MITMDKIAMFERDSQKEGMNSVSNTELKEFCHLAKSALAEIEHHESEIKSWEEMMHGMQDNEQDLDFARSEIDYHRARLSALKKVE